MSAGAAAAACLLALSACAGEVPPGRGRDVDAPASAIDAPAAPDAPAGPDAGPPGQRLGTYRLTFYWVTLEEDFSGPADTVLYDSSCNALATVTAAFADSLAMEGTGRLRDGRMLNYAGPCGCPTSPCFVVLGPEYPWGVGAAGRALVPFRSVAVDRDLIALGTRLWIAELDGVAMPGDPPTGGYVHDGCVRADDVGGAILGEHIDFFGALHAWASTIAAALGGADSITLHEGGARCAP